MRKQLIHAVLALGAVAGLAACTPGTGNGDPSSPAGPASESPSESAAPTESPTEPGPSPDTETTVPAPSPSAVPPPSAGPGEGNAELAITVKASEGEAGKSYTLVCSNGAPAAESEHPTASAACSALKNNPAVVSPLPRKTDQACTQQYGGPQQATVTGIVDGRPIEAAFSLRDGCEIGQWNAAKDILGSTGGAP